MRADLFRRIVEASDDLLTIVDDRGRFVYVNQAAEDVFGVPASACIGREAFDFVHADDREATRAAVAIWIDPDAPARFRFTNRQVSVAGVVRRFEWTITRHVLEGEPPTSGGAVYLASIARDVTARSEARIELERAEARHRAMLASMLDAFVTIDPRGVVREASDSVEAVFGWVPHELIGQNVKVLMPEPHSSKHDGYLAKYARTGETWILNSTRTFEIVRKDGSLRTCDLSVSRVDVPGVSEPLFCGSFRDVTERVEAERKLAESERRFRAVFEQEFQYVGLLDARGTLLEINRSPLRAARVRREDVLGLPFQDAPWWSRSAETREKLERWIAAAARGELVRSELGFVASEAEVRTLDFSLKPILRADRSVEMLIAEGRDITGLKRAQERETAMLRTLASVGESAAVLAHEIKNPITSIHLALRAVAEQLGEDHRVVLEDLVARMRRLERMLRRTLSFAKPLELERAHCATRELVAQAAAGVAPKAKERGIALDVHVHADCPDSTADAGLIEEVLTNLLLNAIDFAARRVVLSARREGDRLALRVDDDGPGIPDRDLEAVFEPFFTTRPEGTGIGLAVCRRIVEAHGGTIAAGHAPIGGASIHVHLPARSRDD